MSGRALPLVRADTALVSGWSAWMIARTLDRHLAGELDQVPDHRVVPVLATLDAIRVAALAWEDTEATRSSSTTPPIAAVGNSATTDAATSAKSEHDDLSVDEAAAMMGLGVRRVRMLAPALGGRKVAGVWVLDRGAVLAELEARREVA